MTRQLIFQPTKKELKCKFIRISKEVFLQYVDGHPFYKVVKGELTRKESLDAVTQLVEALRYALNLGYMHLDLHGGNLMMDFTKHIKVIDLASFYTFDELYQFAANPDSQQEVQTSYEDSPHKLDGKEKRPMLKQFFSAHPKLLKEMQKPFAAKKIPPQNDAKQDPAMTPMLSYYFDRITEVCIDLLIRSNFPREQKIALRTTIKTLAWNYTEDAEEGKRSSIDDYFNRLTRIIQSTPAPR